MEINKGDFIKVIGRDVEFVSYGSILEVLDTGYTMHYYLPSGESEKICQIYVKDNAGHKTWWEDFEPYVKKLTPKEVDKYIDKIFKRTEF